MAIIAILVCSIIGLGGAFYGLIIGDLTLLGAFSFYLVASLGCAVICVSSYLQKFREPKQEPPAQAVKA